MSQPDPASLPPQLITRLNDRPAASAQVPMAQSLRSTYVSLFNFPPGDFNFYQQPAAGAPDPLAQNLLRGAYHFDPDCSISVTNTNVAGGSSSTHLPALTIELWVRLPANSSTGAFLFSYRDGNGSYVQLRNPVGLQLVTSLASSTSFSSGESIADDLWHHVALVIGADRRPLLYVDTRLVPFAGSPVLTSMPKDRGTFVAGSDQASDSTAGCGGYLGQIRLWKTARALPEIVAAAGTAAPDSVTDLSLYWGDQVDVAGCRAIDSSLTHNDGAVHVSNQLAAPWWDTSQRYGALEDSAHTNSHPVNMTGNLVLDQTQLQCVECSAGNLALDASARALTFEFWIKAGAARPTDSTVIVRLRMSSGSDSSASLTIANPLNLTVYWGNVVLASGGDVCDGRWHHVAVVVTWSHDQSGAATAAIYRDAQRIVSRSGSIPSPAISANLFLVLGGDGSTHTSNYFTGSLAEFRVWQCARSESDILADASYRLVNPPAELRLYWPFGRDFRSDALVEDYSSYNSFGTPLHSPGWDDGTVYGVYANHIVVPPMPAGSSGAVEPMTTWAPDAISSVSSDGLLDGAAAGFPRVSQEDLLQAFTQAQASGFFDKRYFPNIRGVKSDRDHHSAKSAIADLDPQVFLTNWIMGRRLDLVRRKRGRFAYRFIPAPLEAPAARLMLVETYRLSAFLGDVGQGQVVRTFSLMPGENASFSVSTFKETTTTAQSASSIFDSYNQSAQDSFERALGTDNSTETSEAAELDFYADADVKERWGTGNADVSAGLSGSGSISHSNFYQQTTNAVRSHAAEASSARNVEVDTSYTVQTAENRQTSLTREVRNINNGRTLDLIFRQLGQEYLTLLHLVDLRVGYYDPTPGSFRAVALSELDGLLDAVLVDDAALKLTYKQTIINQAYAVASQREVNGSSSFIVCRDRSTGALIPEPNLAAITAGQAFAVDANCVTDYYYPQRSDVVLKVAGIVMAHTEAVMRTDNVVAEAWVGASVALDPFSQGLQIQQLQRGKTENDFRAAEAAKLDQANAIVAAGDQAKAAVYAQVFPAPRVNNNVLYADETGIPRPA